MTGADARARATERREGANQTLRDEIKAYWSARAETFDLSPGHEIFTEAERAAWQALIRRHLGEAKGRPALDLACGTAVVSHLLDDLGFRVTGLDWAEPMLERARAKARQRGRAITFRMADAETTMEPDAAYDVIVTRHLVWTLVDPAAAFAEWRRVLKPGGRLLIVDGDFVNQGLAERLVKRLSTLIQRVRRRCVEAPHQSTAELAATHAAILQRVYFSSGAQAEAVAALLEAAGFVNVTIDRNLKAIHRAQSIHWTRLKALSRSLEHRYAISATRPVDGA
ncbi:methyltransferase [Xaviernesmea oryzae]|uniref:Methyltransferase n=1 Tax=Xaviernesmea oryzae TaxID=464029 RepID=A0A1Q9ARF7_9HYPH|nr:class I SAM-dependent methyltransferase [Xaviernesmea oryzae]OLP57961.1 methyltransferase [Xaviernesmea oryzae]SEL28850.1 Methyltransferase domain-containing protein [Xaviernesmea oryzae]